MLQVHVALRETVFAVGTSRSFLPTLTDCGDPASDLLFRIFMESLPFLD